MNVKPCPFSGWLRIWFPAVLLPAEFFEDFFIPELLMLYAQSKSFKLSLLAGVALSSSALVAVAQQVRYSTEHRDHEHVLPQTVSTAGASSAMKARMRAGREAVSLAVADFDADGTRDLISGYASGGAGVLLLQRGSALAMSPTPNEWPMLQRGELVAPYRENAEAIELPVRPDLLQTADIRGMGHADVLVAAKGGGSLYVLFSRGDGSFAAPSELRLAGSVQSMATWTSAAGENLIVAGVCGRAGCGLQVIDREGKTRAFVSAPGAVTQILTGAIDGGSRKDLVYIANERPMVLDGETLLSGSPVIEKLNVAHAAAVAVGYFVADRRGYQQVAVLDEGATLHVLTRAGLDSTVGTSEERVAAHRAEFAQQSVQATAARQISTAMRASSGIQMASVVQPVSVAQMATSAPVKRTGSPWSEVETLSNIGPGGENPILLAAKLTTGGNDDLAVLSGNNCTTVSHTISRAGTQVTTTPVVSVDSSNAPVMAAVATRVSADARLGLVTALRGAQPLSVSVPPTYKTYTVNTTNDGNDDLTSTGRCTGTGTCTLRDAVNLANHDRSVTSPGTNPNTTISKSDTINVPAGTYTLSVRNPSGYGSTTPVTLDMLGSVNYHLEVDCSANIVGAGSASTIINGGNLDQVFSVDWGSYASTGSGDFESPQVDVFFSGMTVQNGRNPNNYNNNPSSNPYGGNIYWEAEPSSNLVLNNMVLRSGTTAASGGTNIGGGGIAAGFDYSNSSQTAGPLDIENSTITANSDVSGSGGGGIAIYFAVPLTLISDTISSNTSSGGGGGGVNVDENGAAMTATITGTTISSNTASNAGSYGGGLNIFGGLTMSGSTVSNNSGVAYGGGLYLNNAGSGSTSLPGSITTSTFTGNSLTGTLSGPTYTQDGGGVCLVGSSSGLSGSTLTLQYSRFHANTVTVGTAATGLAVGCDRQISSTNPAYATVTATDNWWGCNGAGAGTGCDTAHTGNVTNATLTLTPYTKLTLGLSAASLPLGSTITATGSLGQDSANTVYSAANDVVYLATPISAFTLTNTGTVTYSPSATAFSVSAATSASNAAATASATTTSAGTGTATITVDGQTLTSNYAVLSPPTISAGFLYSPVAPGAYSTIVFTLGNPSANTASLTGVGFTVTLPTNLTVYTTPGVSTTCSGGTTTATAGSSSISFSGATIASGSSCTVQVNVYSNTAATYTVTTGSVMSTNGGTGGSATAYFTAGERNVQLVSLTIHKTGATSGYITAYFPFSGSVTPTGAFTMLVNGSSTNVSGMTCVAKNYGSGSGANHIGCSALYNASSVAVGNYTFTASQAADSNYAAVSGTGFVTVAAQ